MKRKETVKKQMKKSLWMVAFVILFCVGNIAYAEPLVDTEEAITEEVVTTEETTEEKVVPVILKTPSQVKVKEQSGLKAKLTWKKVSKATEYVIYRSTKKTKGYKKIGTAKKTSFVDTKVSSGKAYYYRITAVKKHKPELTSEKSEAVAVYMKPLAPKVNYRYLKKKVKLSWKKINGAQKYYVYKKGGNGNYKKIGETTKLYYNDSEVKKGSKYYYKVRAVYVKDGKNIQSKTSTVCKALAMPLDPNKKMIALTFDDGPGRYTKDIVECLKKNNAKATFFVLGCNIDSYKSAVKSANRIGCEIANHSYSHSNMVRLSEKEIKEEISMTDKKIKKITGKNSKVIRTPGGSTNATVQNAVGKPIVLWSIDTRDWETRNKDKTIDAVIGKVRDGDIVLMHDIYEPTKDAACALIVELESQGYQLVTVSELAQYRDINMKKGSIYYSLRRK